jgi:hypothetical protein
MAYDDNVKILHWLPEENRWEPISWDVWSKFRGISEPGVGMPGIAGGIHYFVVCPHDGKHVINILTHKYILETDGTIGRSNLAGLTREERADYSRILVLMQQTEEDVRKMDAIHAKLGLAYDPPAESIEALKAAISLAPLAGSLADKFFQEADTPKR